MRVHISADLEGATGVYGLHQLYPAGRGYEGARQLWLQDLEHLAAGAVRAGAREVVICEAHATADHLLAGRFGPEVRLVSGYIKPGNQMHGCDETCVASLMITHVRAGAAGVLGHSYLLPDLFAVKLNGAPCGELALNAAWAGVHGVPVALVVGDDAVAREAQELLPGVLTAVTKRHVSQLAAECLTPAATGPLLEEAACQAVQAAARGRIPPYRVAPPYVLELSFTMPAMASMAALIPGVEQTDPRTVQFVHHDYRTVMQVRIAACNLAKGVGDQVRRAQG